MSQFPSASGVAHSPANAPVDSLTPANGMRGATMYLLQGLIIFAVAAGSVQGLLAMNLPRLSPFV